MEALTGKGHGRGLHVDPFLPTNTRNIYIPKTSRGAGGEKKSKYGKGLLLGKNSPFNNIPILGAIF